MLDSLLDFLKAHGIIIGGYSWEEDQEFILCVKPELDQNTGNWDAIETPVRPTWTDVRAYLGY